MSHNLGDTAYPHHPDFTPIGDVAVNTRYLIGGDTVFLVMDEVEQDIAWNIVLSLSQDISWHIFPEFIPYIQQFIIKYIRTKFNLEPLSTSFQVCPIKTAFNITNVIDDNVSLKESNMDMSFYIVPPRYTFTLKNPLVSDFKITRILDNTRRP